MRRLSHRVPSFTLVELLVVMVLTSIVVGILYSAFYSVFTYQSRLNQKQKVDEDMITLYFQLKTDTERSRSIRANSGISVSCLLDGGEHVDYSFDSLFTVRSQINRIDTFYCATGMVVYQFEKEQIHTYPSVVDAFQLTLVVDARTVEASFIKKYDAASLIGFAKSDSIR